MYLYQDLNRHPSTIDGYRMAIVVTLGPAGRHISQSLTGYFLAFTGVVPMFQESSKWDLSVVFNEFTKAFFEPMKDTDLKHLTVKTAFLLALASGKHHSEMYAWVANKSIQFRQMGKGSCVPLFSFHS